ncbi:MAG TPA: type I restriction enzyme HsdR N-terminal domain-containing protein [Saprospiraceae bacterium]|nr:type I restriction enzyme HsdR N-terminal domain-containing protein [Saprospiraceae bacterium]
MKIDLQLNRYKDRLEIKKQGNKTFIKDKLRKKFIILQPEEMVRQLLIEFFIENLIYPLNLVQIEKSIFVNNVPKRFDLIVYDRTIKPFLLVECKSHKIALNQNVVDQIAIYNMAVQAPYLLVTNGMESICIEINPKEQSFRIIDHLPPFPN